MSLSNPTTKNPATRFIQWRGGSEEVKDEKGKVTGYTGGRLTWYDKEAQEEKEIKLPFSFIVLDELNTITGYSEPDHSGFWSNEVRFLQTDEFVVRTSAGIKARGLYANIADKIKAGGAKYAKSVYIAFKDDSGEMVIGNIKLSGSSLTPWIDFQKKYDVSQCAVYITDEPKQGKKGKNVYFMPVFEGQNISDQTKAAAVALDQQLQVYLSSYLLRKPDENEAVVTDDEEPKPSKPADDVDIEDVAEKEEPKAPVKATPKDEGEKEKINLKDVPF